MSDAVEVVLRFPDDHGVVDMTPLGTLEAHKHDLIFKRDADRGIGEPAHRSAFVTSVVPLGEGLYRLEDPWHAHPLKLRDNEEAIGGLAFRDVFLAERLPDGSLRFDRIVQKGNWRVIDWFLGSFLMSPHLGGGVCEDKRTRWVR